MIDKVVRRVAMGIALSVFTAWGAGPWAAAVGAAEFHVAPAGNDANPGTAAAPLRTIQHAADLAQPGDIITVHEGVYRERIAPPRGGTSDTQRIVYQAAPGEKVEIKGSEVVKNWVKVQDDVWKATLPNTLFGNFNPYSDLIHGDWFNPRGRQHHTGAVYLHGYWLTEAARLDDVLKPARPNAALVRPGRPARTPRSGPNSRASIPTSKRWRSTSAAPSSIPRRRA